MKILQKKAFTLVELLIVMVIVGILMGLAVFGLGVAQQTTRDTDRKSSLSQIGLALESYYNVNKMYRCPDGNDGCFEQQMTDQYVKDISGGAPIPAPKSSKNGWGDFYVAVNDYRNGTGPVFYVKTTLESNLPGCNSKDVYYAGGIKTDATNSKDVWGSIPKACWVN